VADRPDVEAALGALPARTWALLLRELRTVLGGDGGGGPEDGPEAGPGADGRAELARLLAGPRSAVAAGVGRSRVASILAADAALRAVLAARPPLSEARAALDGDGGVDLRGATGAADVPGADAAPADAADRPATPPADGGARDLRAELARVRRQRDGADARARAAEDRATAAADEVATLRRRVDELEAQLADATEERERAVERAARRAEERRRDLGDNLAAERSGRERLARDLDRERDRTARLRSELERLRTELAAPRTDAVAPAVRSRPVGLPPGVEPDTTEAARHLLAEVGQVVVDGYNLTLRARADLDLAGQRRWLLERMRPVAARGLGVVVVFDGDRGAGTRRSDVGVDVRFTSGRTIADDEIEFIAGEAADAGIPTLVVTDDAELRRRVAVHDADVVGVLPFVGALG
jgi:hypothetical protein